MDIEKIKSELKKQSDTHMFPINNHPYDYVLADVYKKEVEKLMDLFNIWSFFIRNFCS